MGLESGQLLEHYRLVEKIGEGGMGVVWKAVDTTLDREVAIKILPDAFARDAERLARFEREAKLLASLQHPNIAVIHGLHAAGDVRFLAMELIGGANLAARLSRGALTTEEILDIARQLAEALEAAHEQGVVHRDLKPANIQLTPEGQIKVLDFGLAKAFQPETASGSASVSMSPTLTSLGTVDGMILGTAAYMSPEQARGQTVDKRADVWAFGCVLFEMLGGKMAFCGDTISDTLASVLKLEPEWGSVPEDTPRSIRRLVERCLEKDPKLRLRDVGEARITIVRALQGEPEDTPPATVRTEAEPIAPRGTPVWVWAVSLLLVALVAATAGWMLKPVPRHEPPLRRFPIAVAGLSGAYPRPPVVSPDGKRIAYVADGLLWIRDLDQVEARMIPETEGIHAPFWSWDGQQLGWISGNKVWHVPVTGGARTAVCDTPARIDGAAWGPDDRIVLAPGTGPLYEVSARGGDPTVLLEPVAEEESDFHKPHFLPDGRGLLYGVHRSGTQGSDTLEVLADGQRKVVLRIEDHRLEHAHYSDTGHIVYERSRGNDGVWAVPFSLETLETTGEPMLIDPAGGTPSVSRDGSLVFRQGSVGTQRQLVWVDRDGKELAEIGQPQAGLMFPALSPDGRLVAVSANEEDSRDIWIHDTERGTRTRLTFDSSTEWAPSWTADGERVLFSLEFGVSAAVMIKPADGTGETIELAKGAEQVLAADGSTLVFQATNRDTGDDLMVVAPETGESPAVFLQTPHDEENPQLSPDGRYAAYVSNESGNREVYVKRFPSGEGKWQVSVDGGRWPRWSPHGRELFYTNDQTLMVVELDSSKGLRLGTPRLLFDRGRTGYDLDGPRPYDVAPDGRRFVVVKDLIEVDSVPSLVFVENWIAQFQGPG